MRIVLGILSLLIVLAVVASLAKRQVAPADAGGSAATPAPTPAQQVEQIQQTVEGLMQRPRPMPDGER